jgi:hypothetical protein
MAGRAGRVTQYSQIVDGLSEFDHRLFRITNWGGYNDEECQPVTELADADVISSEIADNRGTHTVMLDLDVPAKLVPSTTEGHSHLYIDVPIKWHDYTKLLQALADAGIIEEGYRSASLSRGRTSLRLPWVKKESA